MFFAYGGAMAEIQDSSKVQQIRTLLFVFGSGIVVAFALAFFMLHYYNPSGSYEAKNALVDPAALADMRFSEPLVRGGDNTPYVFQEFEFTYYDYAAKQWKRLPIQLKDYAEFYALVAKDQSLASVPDDVKSSFNLDHPASLALKIRRENASQGGSRDFIKVDFVERGNHFRIQLREQGDDGEGWAYFYHPDVYKQILQLFTHP